jgi:serine protease Do
MKVFHRFISITPLLNSFKERRVRMRRKNSMLHNLLTSSISPIFVFGLILLFSCALLLTACSREEEKTKTPEKASIATPPPSAPEYGEMKTPADLSSAIVWVAKKTIPAVVHIEVVQSQEVVNPFVPFENDPFFQHFFNFPKMPRKFKRELKALGTGMIMDSQGHILTNYHVVGGATKIQVLLASGELYSAKIIGTDPKTDLAVIQISAGESLPYVTFGDSDKIEVGEWVVAIGHPRGLDQTVTQGIISAKHRTGIMDPSSYQDFLQTDAAINPGNSGGPLLNIRGKVIGINSAIMSQSGGFEGIGFAIPSNMALYIADQLIAHGKIERGWLGVSIQDLTPQLAEAFKIKRVNGALIAGVVKGSPADKAGIKRGDIVILFNGKEILNASTLQNEVAITAVGQKAKITVLRDGKKIDIEVVIGNLKDEIKLLSSSVKERLGIKARLVRSRDVTKYDLGSKKGVVITWVDPNGPLGKLGFETGDIILKINGQDIKSLEDFESLVNVLKPHQKISVLAIDHRTGNEGYIEVVVR